MSQSISDQVKRDAWEKKKITHRERPVIQQDCIGHDLGLTNQLRTPVSQSSDQCPTTPRVNEVSKPPCSHGFLPKGPLQQPVYTCCGNAQKWLFPQVETGQSASRSIRLRPSISYEAVFKASPLKESNRKA